jgi:hypothetical protein
MINFNNRDGGSSLKVSSTFAEVLEDDGVTSKINGTTKFADWISANTIYAYTWFGTADDTATKNTSGNLQLVFYKLVDGKKVYLTPDEVKALGIVAEDIKVGSVSAEKFVTEAENRPDAAAGESVRTISNITVGTYFGNGSNEITAYISEDTSRTVGVLKAHFKVESTSVLTKDITKDNITVSNAKKTYIVTVAELINGATE